jgi:hypothetical protein
MEYFVRSGLEQISSTRKDVTEEQARLDALILRWRQWYERFHDTPQYGGYSAELGKWADYAIVLLLKKRRDTPNAR